MTLSEKDQKLVNKILSGEETPVEATVWAQGKLKWKFKMTFDSLGKTINGVPRLEKGLTEEAGLDVIKTTKARASNASKKSVDSRVSQTSKQESSSPHPICPIHNQPMNKKTKNGVPYHTYKGKNCSGKGWWGEENTQ